MHVEQPATAPEQGLTARIRAWWRRTVDRAAQGIDGLPARGAGVRIVAGLGLLALAVGMLIVLNMALFSWGLWGDLVFALAVVTVVLWALYRVTRPLLRRNRRFWPFPRALSMAVTLLVGVPVALAIGAPGFVALAVAPAVWLLIALARRFARTRLPQPPLWPLALAGVALMLVAVPAQPRLLPAEDVPGAVPAAQEERRHADIAEQFRPFLFFDMSEQRYPLDIDKAIADGRVQMCRPSVRDDGCAPLEAAAEIDDGSAYLAISDAPWRQRGGDERSAVYYRVDPQEPPTYVDYWWFYAHNPSPVAGDVFCGPGLRTPPFTCQEHQGDWEGVTVLLGSCAGESETCLRFGTVRLAPSAVRYAQHEHVVQYSWNELEGMWDELPEPTSAPLVLVWDRFVRPAVADGGPRPLVFVARNSHASYPVACLGHCRHTTRSLPEGRHNGGQPWTHNLVCDDCLQPLPLTPEGEPALWNAFSGRWGAQRCILGGAYCDFSAAPPGPAQQQRYTDPAGTGR